MKMDFFGSVSVSANCEFPYVIKSGEGKKVDADVTW